MIMQRDAMQMAGGKEIRNSIERVSNCAVPIIIGDSPNTCSPQIFTGTGTLVKVKDRKICITCKHVVDKYLTEIQSNHSVVFQIGDLIIPELWNAISAAEEDLDLAVIDISNTAGLGLIFPSNRYYPIEIPCKVALSSDDLFSVVGFPGQLRESTDAGTLKTASIVALLMECRDLSDSQIIISLEEEHYITQCCLGQKISGEGRFGGMSGGPVFVFRNGEIPRSILIGIVKEYSELMSGIIVSRLSPFETILGSLFK